MSTSRKRSRLMFLCAPRSGSTSILKCFNSHFHDSEAWFEPYNVCNLVRKMIPDQDLPLQFEGNEGAYLKMINRLEKQQGPFGYSHDDGREFSYSYVKQSLENSSKDIVIVKDIGIAFKGERLEYLPSADSGYRYVFIIRDPYRVMSSYRNARINELKKRGIKKFEECMDESAFNILKDDILYGETGSRYINLHEAWKHVHAHLDPNPLVIDTEDLLANPKPYLQRICEVGGLEYHDGLLNWDKSTDMIMKWRHPFMHQMITSETGSAWIGGTLASSSFHPSSREKPSRSSLTPDVLEAIDAGIDYYNEMYDQRYTA